MNGIAKPYLPRRTSQRAVGQADKYPSLGPAIGRADPTSAQGLLAGRRSASTSAKYFKWQR